MLNLKGHKSEKVSGVFKCFKYSAWKNVFSSKTLERYEKKFNEFFLKKSNKSFSLKSASYQSNQVKPLIEMRITICLKFW